MGVVCTSVQHKISCPALLYRAFPHNIGEFFAGNLLPSLMATVIEDFEVFCHLEKHLKCLFGLFYDLWVFLSYLAKEMVAKPEDLYIPLVLG